MDVLVIMCLVEQMSRGLDWERWYILMSEDSFKGEMDLTLELK